MMLAMTDPQSNVDAMLADPQFPERFARFLNAEFNRRPGVTPAEDAAYYLGKFVVERKLPFREMFLGPYMVDADPAGQGVVRDDPEGLGYFRSRAWMVRYAGNESTGLKIVTAYRILNNVIGLKLTATTNAPDVDVSVTGRAKAACSGCHFEGWSALDNVAKILSRREGKGEATKFIPSTSPPQPLLDKTIANDKELVTSLVESEAFRFNACRLAFTYLYGRAENACEAPIFDACVKEFTIRGTIQSAIASVAKDPSFCQ